MDILEKLGIIQTKLKAPKNQFNKFGNYYYRNAEDIQEAVKPLLAETKAVLTISDDISVIGDRFYVKATAKLIDAESSDSVEVTAFAREPVERKGMDDAQVTGATSSYARKYALCGLFLLDDTKDPDSMDNSQKPTTTPKRAATQQTKDEKKSLLLSPAQMQTIEAEMKRTGVSVQQILKRTGANELKWLTPEEADNVIKDLRATPSQA